MAFFSKVGNILRQTVSKQINSNISMSNPSICQMIRSMSSSKVFVGGLSYGTDDMSLREAFSKYGEVVEARVIVDRETGRSRGFGFITFTSTEEASSAIQAVDGQDLHGRRVRVDYATDRARGFGGGGYGGGFGGGNFGGGGGGNYGSSDGYASGGNYGGSDGYASGGGGSVYPGGNNYDRGSTGTGNYGGGSTFDVAGGGNAYPSGSNSDSGSTGNYGGSGTLDVAGGDGRSGNDNVYAGAGGSSSSFADQFGSNEGSGNTGAGFGDFRQADTLEENTRDDDDDEPDDYANRRA